MDGMGTSKRTLSEAERTIRNDVLVYHKTNFRGKTLENIALFMAHGPSLTD